MAGVSNHGRAGIRTRWRALVVVLTLAASVSWAHASGRVAEIQQRDELRCGIWPHVAGFATQVQGRYVGFDVDTCRAVAVAVLGDASKVRFEEVASVEQFTQDRGIDLAVRRLTWTPAREQASGTVFGPVTFYDGQGLLVTRRSGLRTEAQLAGRSVCVVDTERDLATLHDHFRDRGLKVQLLVVRDDAEAEAALRRGECQAYSADLSWLAAARSRFAGGKAAYVLWPTMLSKEPLAPLMRAEDADLIRVVRWTVYGLIGAEELGLRSADAGVTAPPSAAARAFLAVPSPASGPDRPAITLRTLIAGVGNYGELFERNLGAGGVGLARGLNRPWNQGGLLYAPPLDR